MPFVVLLIIEILTGGIYLHFRSKLLIPAMSKLWYEDPYTEFYFTIINDFVWLQHVRSELTYK